MGTNKEQNRISAILPTLDAAATLPQALSALCAPALLHEIIVADGGSRDDTLALARAAGARIVAAPRGRGTQLAAGAAAATGEWLLFVHADCRLAAGWERAVLAFISMPGAAGRAGYCDLILDDGAPAARRLERIVAWRCRLWALPYGDQGLLIARRLYDAVGGFRPLPLMEDVDLVRRLGRRRLVPLGVPILASARRYRSGGYLRRPLLNLFCLSLYFAGVSPARIARLYEAGFRRGAPARSRG
jgi:rSAM/selenodomain-associated transferase 2